MKEQQFNIRKNLFRKALRMFSKKLNQIGIDSDCKIIRESTPIGSRMCLRVVNSDNPRPFFDHILIVEPRKKKQKVVLS